MKIGVITFHWGPNHGGILQSYATTTYLNRRGVDAFIIDYYPKNLETNFINALRSCRPRNAFENFLKLRKEKALAPFRKNLPLSKRYYANAELIANPPVADVYITGSDQVWNPYFLSFGEKRVTPVYFLNFGGANVKKIALSASFGCSEYPEKAAASAIPYLKDFAAISVRENTGLEILRKMGLENATLTADPVALLDAEEYLRLCSSVKQNSQKTVALCILRKQSATVKAKIAAALAAANADAVVDIEKAPMERWLAGIRDARLVVTNSFHCVLFCLKFHTPFVAVLEDGSKAGMNDRLNTLLARFGAFERVWPDDPAKRQAALRDDYDWTRIDAVMDEYAQTVRTFLDANALI